MRVILCLAAALLCGSAQACQLKSAIDCAEAERVVGDLERAYDRFTALGVDVPLHEGEPVTGLRIDVHTNYINARTAVALRAPAGAAEQVQ